MLKFVFERTKYLYTLIDNPVMLCNNSDTLMGVTEHNEGASHH